MKKLLLPTLIMTFALSACQKPEESAKPTETAEPAKTQTADTPAPTTENTAPSTENPTPKAEEHKHDEHKHDNEKHEHDAKQKHDDKQSHAGGDHDHKHDGHDHAHDHAGHDHSHHDGDKYQCGDKTIHIAIHDHEGEPEAHITADDITYDLNPDVQTKGRFTSSDDSISGNDKGMALTINGNKAKVTTLDDKVLLDCTKAS